MLAIVDPEDAYELHMNLIRHGRELCRPKPRCGECELRRMCPWYRAGARNRAAGAEYPRRMSKQDFIAFGLLVVVLAVVIPWLAFRANGDAATRRPGGARAPEGRPVPLPDQLRHLPHALRGRHRRQLRPGPRRTAGAHRPGGTEAARTIEGDRRPRPQRGRKRRRQHDHPGPHAGRHPQPEQQAKKSPNSSPTPPARASGHPDAAPRWRGARSSHRRSALRRVQGGLARQLLRRSVRAC